MVAEGPMPEILKNLKQNSLTLALFARKEFIEVPDERRSVGTKQEYLKIRGAHANNLKNIDVDIPLRRFSR